MDEAQGPGDGEAAVSMEEVRQRRLAYFQNSQAGTGPDTANSAMHNFDRVDKKREASSDKQPSAKKTSEFHIQVSVGKEGTRGGSQSTEPVASVSLGPSSRRPSEDIDPRHDVQRGRRRKGSGSSQCDQELGPVVNPALPVVNPALPVVNPTLSAAAPPSLSPPQQTATRSLSARDRESEVDHLFRGRQWAAGPALRESVEGEVANLFTASTDLDTLGLSTHRPQASPVAGDDRRRVARQRSLSSESVGVGVGELRWLLGEDGYRAFVDKAQRDLHQLHSSSRREPSPTPPPQPPSPQSAGRRGPSPRRRLRSSSPQLVGRTLQDIARGRERESKGEGRNYEQEMVQHSVAFSADEIYRQAYGGGADAGSTPWMSHTPRQATPMSPSSPHNPLFHPPAHYPSSPPSAQQAYAGLAGSARSTLSLPGGGARPAQYAYLAMAPSTPPVSPDSYLYQHPLTHSMPPFQPPLMAWHYESGHAPMFHHQGQPVLQGQGQNMFQAQPVFQGQGPSMLQGQCPSMLQGQPVQSPYNQGWSESVTMLQSPHPPLNVVPGNRSSFDSPQGRSATQHVEAVRQHHEQRRQRQEKQSPVTDNFSSSSLDRYFSSLGLAPPSHAPPSHAHHAPPSHAHHAPLSQRSEEELTEVTGVTAVTGTSVVGQGVTERLQRLGVDPRLVQAPPPLSQAPAPRTLSQAADERALEALRSLVRVCPECAAVNKEYMTWCLSCGGVLIGIHPVPARDLKRRGQDRKGHACTPSQAPLHDLDSDDLLTPETPPPAPTSSGVQWDDPVPENAPNASQLPAAQEELVPPHGEGGAFVPPHGEGRVYVPPHGEGGVYVPPHGEGGVYVPPHGEGGDWPGPTPNHKQAVVTSVIGEPGASESPESGRGASASSSPARRPVPEGRDPGVGEGKDSGRPSSGEGVEAPRRSQQEIDDICSAISDPVIRSFVNTFLHRHPADAMPDLTNANRKTMATAAEQRPGCHGDQDVSARTGPGWKENGQTGKGKGGKGGAAVKSKRPESGKRRRGLRRGHEAIDVEIFAIEEARVSRSARQGPTPVPPLNLALSSEEDDDWSQQTGQQATPTSDSSCEDHAPVNYCDEVKAMSSDNAGRGESTGTDAWQQGKSAVAEDAHQEGEQAVAEDAHQGESTGVGDARQEMAANNFLFLQQLVDEAEPAQMGAGPAQLGAGPAQKGAGSAQKGAGPALKGAGPGEKGAGLGQARPQVIRRPSPTSRVRSSVEAAPQQRRWVRSSIAWSSYHPRELRTRSSLPLPSGPAPGKVKASRSTDSLAESGHAHPVPSQRPRPASADMKGRRDFQRGRGRGARPFSAGHQSRPDPLHSGEAIHEAGGDHCDDSPAPSPRSLNTDIEGRPIHRLVMDDRTLTLIPTGPTTATKIYNSCTAAGSKWLFLPTEMWLHVFSFLPPSDLYNLTLTCKQLSNMAQDPQLWRHVTVRKKKMKDAWLQEIARRGPVSLALIQCHGDVVTETALRELFKEVAPKLKELNISRCSRGRLVGDEILLFASTHCRQLTHVDASWCHVTDVGLTALADCCHRLESLCLNGCQQITDDSFQAMVEKHGASLRVLELFGCFSLTPASYRHLGQYCTFLLTLNLGQCHKMSDSNMVTLSASLSRLETLDLRGCKRLGDNCIRKIVRNCPRLRHLTLANCPLLSNAAVTEIATYSSDIRSLDLCGCNLVSDASVRTLASNCARLTSLDISSTSCSHRSVLVLADACRGLEVAKFNFLPDIHDQSLSRLLKHCKRLHTLHLYGCNVRDIRGLQRYNRFLAIEA